MLIFLKDGIILNISIPLAATTELQLMVESWWPRVQIELRFSLKKTIPMAVEKAPMRLWNRETPISGSKVRITKTVLFLMREKPLTSRLCKSDLILCLNIQIPIIPGALSNLELKTDPEEACLAYAKVQFSSLNSSTLDSSFKQLSNILSITYL